jgi:cell division protein FtsI/penicillin-binding protein 2
VVEDRLRDAVLAQEYGVWRFSGDAARSREATALAERIAVAFADDDAAAEALEIAAAAQAGTFAGSAEAPFAPRAGDVVGRAREAGLFDYDPERVREAAAWRVIEGADFDLDAYHDARKRGRMRDDLAAFRTDVVGRDGGFRLADLVDGPGGLAELGFKLTPSFGRDPERAHGGTSLALLLGTVTPQGVPSTGLEEELDRFLRGEPGAARVRPDGSAETAKPPRHGADVRTTLSAPLQDRLEKIARRAGAEIGAAVVVDVDTGGVLAASTWPSPPKAELEEALAEALAAQTDRTSARRAMNQGERAAASRFVAADRRLRRSAALHRAFSPPGQTPPGSVFKALTVLVGLEAGVIDERGRFLCDTGRREQGFSCERHGEVDVLEALERSCNAYCYDVGQKVGKPALLDAFARVGLFEAAPGVVTRAEGRALEKLLREGSDDVRNLAIGQGSLSVSPARLAGVAASLARGRVVIPHLYAPEGFAAVRGPLGTEPHLETIREGLRRAAQTSRGTAGREHRGLLEPLKIAGKTGTAQLVTAKESLNAAWFVGFAPYGPGLKPRFAFAVMLDRSAHHGSAAAPIAADVVGACYDVLGGGP